MLLSCLNCGRIQNPEGLGADSWYVYGVIGGLNIRSVRGKHIHTAKPMFGDIFSLRYRDVTNALSPLSIMHKYVMAQSIGEYNRYRYGIKLLRMYKSSEQISFVTHRMIMLI